MKIIRKMPVLLARAFEPWSLTNAALIMAEDNCPCCIICILRIFNLLLLCYCAFIVENCEAKLENICIFFKSNLLDRRTFYVSSSVSWKMIRLSI